METVTQALDSGNVGLAIPSNADLEEGVVAGHHAGTDHFRVIYVVREGASVGVATVTTRTARPIEARYPLTTTKVTDWGFCAATRTSRTLR